MEWSEKYNPFNSSKALIHVPYWASIKDGIIPYPLYVTLDPCGFCNINCHFCNSKKEMSKNYYSIDMINRIIDLLTQWKTKAVCIGGGGEPFLNHFSQYLLDQLTINNIEIGAITNGTNLKPVINELLQCKWIGVSVDASNKEEYKYVKGGTEIQFNNIIESIKELKQKKGNNRFPELEFKYLITNKNFQSIYDAVKLAKNIGCDFIHIRPGAKPWYEETNKDFAFTESMLKEINIQLDDARNKFEDKQFKIFAVNHKFDSSFVPIKPFNKCYAGLITCHILPNGDIGTCVCKRGDQNLIIGNIYNINNIWGTQKHIELVNNILINECPNCSYGHINEIFENIILDDKTNYNFI